MIPELIANAAFLCAGLLSGSFGLALWFTRRGRLKVNRPPADEIYGTQMEHATLSELRNISGKLGDE